MYGLAESSLAVTVPPLNRGPKIDRVDRETFTTQGRAVPASAESERRDFVCLLGSFVARTRNSPRRCARHEVPERTEGFLWFRGPSATSGYYHNAAATEKLLPQGPAKSPGEFAWVDSGDRAYRADGEIYITGRVKDIIIKGGRNIYPHEVEELAARVDGIRKGCIVAFGLKDEASGHRKTHRRRRSARSRSEKTRADFGRRHRSNFSWTGLASRSRRTCTGGQHSQNIERKIAT